MQPVKLFDRTNRLGGRWRWFRESGAMLQGSRARHLGLQVVNLIICHHR